MPNALEIQYHGYIAHMQKRYQSIIHRVSNHNGNFDPTMKYDTSGYVVAFQYSQDIANQFVEDSLFFCSAFPDTMMHYTAAQIYTAFFSYNQPDDSDDFAKNIDFITSLTTYCDAIFKEYKQRRADPLTISFDTYIFTGDAIIAAGIPNLEFYMLADIAKERSHILSGSFPMPPTITHTTIARLSKTIPQNEGIQLTQMVNARHHSIVTSFTVCNAWHYTLTKEEGFKTSIIWTYEI